MICPFGSDSHYEVGRKVEKIAVYLKWSKFTVRTVIRVKFTLTNISISSGIYLGFFY